MRSGTAGGAIDDPQTPTRPLTGNRRHDYQRQPRRKCRLLVEPSFARRHQRRAEVKEISGLLAEDLPTALREMQALAAQSRSHGNFMYQANLNPQGDEQLTPEQWKEAVDTLEKNLGLEGHQRIVVEHEKGGRTHQHVVWNRVDVETLRVADMGGNYRVHTATARELESRFDLTPTPTQPALDRKADA